MPDVEAQDPRSGLLTWAADQDEWIRWIVAEVIASGLGLGEGGLTEALGRLLAEKGLSDETFEPAPAMAEPSAGPGSAEPLELTMLSECAGVNALAPGQAIEFNPRMTLLYGENASGKSGYVRILKSMASCRSEEPLLSNVYGAGEEPQSANLTYRLVGQEHRLEWRGESGVAPLTRMAVLDTRAMALHLDEDLTYVFTPADLALFNQVYGAIEEVRTRAERAAQDRKPRANPFVSRFERGTAVYKEIEALGPSTEVRVLMGFSVVPPDVSAELQRRRARVEALRPETLAASLEMARNDKDLYGALITTCDVAAGFDADAYVAAVSRQGESSAEFARVTGAALHGQIQEVPIEAEAFIRAGEDVLRAAGIDPYPDHDARCVYCEQVLGESGGEVISARRAWVNDQSAVKRDQARADAKTTSSALRQLRIDSLAERIAAKVDATAETAPVLTAAADLIGSLREAITAIDAGKTVASAELISRSDTLRPLARAHLESAEEVLTALQTKESERRDAFEKERAELAELEARATLAATIDEVTGYVDRARWAHRLETVLARLRGVLRSLTEAGKVASDVVLNRGFEDRFREEAAALAAPPVTLEFPGRQGRAARRKALVPEHRLSEILSEGEQRVIALADFLAEASLRTSVAPLVFDDPVNSLDYKRLKHVVARLVALSAQQQVVVFTHNVMFAFELLGRFEKSPDDCSYFDVGRSETGTGLITGGTHPRTDTVKHLRGEINSLLQDAGTLTGEAQAALIERGYDKMRSWCEVVVEDELLQGVTKRLQPNVQMTKLPQIRGDRLTAAIEPIMETFDKACRVMGGHSQPLETLAVRPTLDEAHKDWEEAQAARQAYLEP